jgi:hypothetical protein
MNPGARRLLADSFAAAMLAHGPIDADASLGTAASAPGRGQGPTRMGVTPLDRALNTGANSPTVDEPLDKLSPLGRAFA